MVIVEERTSTWYLAPDGGEDALVWFSSIVMSRMKVSLRRVHRGSLRERRPAGLQGEPYLKTDIGQVNGGEEEG